MTALTLVGCGFVADLYMRSVQALPGIRVLGAYDIDPARRARFCAHWSLPETESLDALLALTPPDGLVLNLTNPDAHYAVSRACLEAGHHVYSEKPLAMRMDEAEALVALAAERGLRIGSAPCSVLGEAAQTLGRALRDGVAGTPRLVYAELDDGFISQAPVQGWASDSGAPWPWEDEFRVGCTVEHAGYYLTWLIAWFGPVASVTAASAELVPDKLGVTGAAPDFSVATLFFESGMVARLTCSILAPHDHRLRIIGDRGVLELDEAWNNAAPVRFRRRMRIRRRLMELPFARRIRLRRAGDAKTGRWGAAAMNFALGPAEMLAAIAEDRPCRLSPEFALHLNEVTLAIQEAGRDRGAQRMRTRCGPIDPMPWALA